MIVGRIAHYGPPQLAALAEHGIDYELRRLNYDIAGTAYGPAIAALKKLVPVSQILLGSDYPYVPIGDTVNRLCTLDFTHDEIQAIGRHNAVRLLPALSCGKLHRASRQ